MTPSERKFRDAQRSSRRLLKGGKFPLGWRGGSRMWREAKGTLVSHPFKSTGETKYNAEGVWALPRGEKPYAAPPIRPSTQDAFGPSGNKSCTPRQDHNAAPTWPKGLYA